MATFWRGTRVLVTLAALGGLCGCATFEQAYWEILRGQIGTKLIGNQWISMSSKNITYDEAWTKIVNTLGEIYEINVLEKESGYIRTAELKRRLNVTYSAGASAPADFGSAIIVRCTSKNPPEFKVMIKSFRMWNNNWVPMEQVFQQDERILMEIRTLLGVPE
jgi:hypothetical protein